ncbi:MAG: hypothetical protein U9O98_06065 [Asgard group archaeon]|nr:hypothetical protein [Asgard group archaeon]
MKGIITASKLVSTPKEIAFPESVMTDLSELSGDSGKILIVYASNVKAVYFFSVESEVIKVSIKIYPLTSRIVAKIMAKVNEFANKITYSTGLCLVEDVCVWEGFLESRHLTRNLDDVKGILREIEEVQDVNIEEVPH